MTVRTDTPAALNAAIPAPPRDTDQLVVVNGVDWRTYNVLRELLDSPGIRMTYLRGALEIMSPSLRHEHLKKIIARLVEIWAIERNVPLYGYGSTTFKHEARERGLEPDECYTVGAEIREYPEVAIEVVVTSGGLDKLAVYAGLGVREVWFWLADDAKFSLYHLEGERYVASAHSALVPGLDFDELARYVRMPDQHAAVRSLRDRLRAGS